MTRANAAKRALSSICSDLIVLNLPYTFSDTDLRNQFVEYGELVLCEVRKNIPGEMMVKIVMAIWSQYQ